MRSKSGFVLSKGQKQRNATSFAKKLVFVFCLTLCIVGVALTTSLSVFPDNRRSNSIHNTKNAYYDRKIDGGRAVSVEFAFPGYHLKLSDAFDLEFTIPLHGKKGTGMASSDAERKDKKVKIFIGVCSSCCQSISLERRYAVRNTWLEEAIQLYPTSLKTRFFLSQPQNQLDYDKSLVPVAKEAASFGDITILPGADTYINLRVKTFALMRYFSALPEEYTHLLKTDDDTWIRAPPLMMSLYKSIPVSLSWLDPKVAVSLMAASTPISLEDLTEQEALGKEEIYRRSTEVFKTHGVWENAKSARKANAASKRVTALLEEDQEFDEVYSVRLPLLDQPRMTGVYLGAIENTNGFIPIRDKSSKWYISKEELPDESIPLGILYNAGWGYILSRDNVHYINSKVAEYERTPEEAPLWYAKIPWEDVLVGYMLSNISDPEESDSFKPAWKLCRPNTAVKHLDVDAPRLLDTLVTLDRSGLSYEKVTVCSSLPSKDYFQYVAYRDALTGSHDGS